MKFSEKFGEYMYFEKLSEIEENLRVLSTPDVLMPEKVKPKILHG